MWRGLAFAATVLGLIAAGVVPAPHAQQPPVDPGRGGGPAGPPPDRRGRRAGPPGLRADLRGVPRRRTVAAARAAATDLTRSVIATANDGGQQLAALLKTGRPERAHAGLLVAADADVDGSVRVLPIGCAPPGAAAGAARITAVVVGDADSGRRYFNGAGGARPCHSPTGDFKGIGSRLTAGRDSGPPGLPRGNGGYPPSVQLAAGSERDAADRSTITPPSGEKIAGHAAVDHRLQRHAASTRPACAAPSRATATSPKVEVTIRCSGTSTT